LPKKDLAQLIVDKTPYRYEMKKNEQGKCFFLKDNQCQIYSKRPLICRFYPFELKYDHDLNIYVFNFTLECPEIGKGKVLTRKDFEELFIAAKQKLL
jgi:Fe-S-cluster containining protein